jgi:hypothetical protein
MACELFKPYKPHAGTLVVVEQANTIIAEYLAQGFALTLRQLFYQFVARALLQNMFKQYKRLGTIVRNARDGGLIDWDALEDRSPHAASLRHAVQRSASHRTATPPDNFGM